jgi:chromosome segregation ATPase
MMSDEEAFQGMREELDRRPSEFETLRARVKELEAELAEMTALSATNLRHRREAEAERDEAIRERDTLKGLTSPTYEALLQKLVSAEATIEKVRK